MALNKIRSLIVDRIGITVKIGSQNLYKFAYGQLHLIRDEQHQLLPDGKIKLNYKKYNTRLDYYTAYSHKRAGRRKIASIIVGTSHKHRYFSLTLFPSQFQLGEFEHFQCVLEMMLPDFHYSKLYATGNVTYLELASDTLSQSHHSFLPYRKYSNTSSIYKEKSGCLGTTYVGSNESKLRFRMYDKRRQLLNTGKPLIAEAAVHTRIEAVLRRLGRTTATLAEMPNPFEKLKIADLTQATALSNDANWQSFLADCLTADGVPDALKKLSQYLRKKYRGMLDSVPAWWWKPGLVWGQLSLALTKIAPYHPDISTTD